MWLKMSGKSMEPLVQSGDACTCFPIDAVTATEWSTFVKEKSEIGIGDVVFCKVQSSGQYYAHLVVWN